LITQESEKQINTECGKAREAGESGKKQEPGKGEQESGKTRQNEKGAVKLNGGNVKKTGNADIPGSWKDTALPNWVYKCVPTRRGSVVIT
jgi:hypothetical protein